jgi:hypothetical protein
MKDVRGRERFEWGSFLEGLDCASVYSAYFNFDVDAIIDYATELDYETGNRYWKDDVDADDYWQFVQDHAK